MASLGLALDGLGARLQESAPIPKPKWFLPLTLSEPVPLHFCWHAAPDLDGYVLSLGKVDRLAAITRLAGHPWLYEALSLAPTERLDRVPAELRIAKILAEDYWARRMQAKIGQKVRMQDLTLVGTLLDMTKHLHPQEDNRKWVIGQLIKAHPAMTLREAEVLTDEEIANEAKAAQS